MTDRAYRTLLGAVLLFVLYFDLTVVMYGVIALVFIEGITNIRLPKLMCTLRKCVTKQSHEYFNPDVVVNARFNFESERAWRIIVAGFLLVGYSLIDALWFFPWFMGFAIFGAGLSGVCPVLFAIRYAGFK